MTVSQEELKQIEKHSKNKKIDGFLHVGKVELPKELPEFDEDFYKWKLEYWTHQIHEKNIKNMVAPMVDQSELAFRMMMHNHNAQLFYTPMIHAHLFVSNPTYRWISFKTCPEDRPLIVQFCANNADTFLNACRLVEGFCDGVDLNLGCPQMVARRGHYGAFLQEEPELIASMISKVHKHCRLPLSVKIRVLDDLEATINYAKMCEKAGASMLVVHGRQRVQKGANSGLADWSKIKRIAEELKIPVIANGNIQMPGDREKCLNETGTVAVMSAEGLLSNPILFDDKIRPCYEIAEEYLEFAEKYKAPFFAIRGHLFRICHHALCEHTDLRPRIGRAKSLEDFKNAVKELRQRYEDKVNCDDGLKFLDGTEKSLTEMVNKIPNYFAKPYIRPEKRLPEYVGLESLAALVSDC